MTGATFQHFRNFWLPLVIIGVLVVLTAWLGQLAQVPQSNGTGKVGHKPDYFVENFNATAFDVSGEPRYRLNAVRMIHYMDDDTTTLDAPWFVREGAGVTRVVVRALRGLVSPDGENVDFIGGVRMMQERAAGRTPMELTTEHLRVVPDRDLISTDRPVVLKEGGSEVRGQAMVADGRQRTLELQGRVKGVYEIHR